LRIRSEAANARSRETGLWSTCGVGRDSPPRLSVNVENDGSEIAVGGRQRTLSSNVWANHAQCENQGRFWCYALEIPLRLLLKPKPWVLLVASVTRKGDGESKERLDAGHDAARFGELFEPMWQVFQGGSDRDGRDAHGDGVVGVC